VSDPRGLEHRVAELEAEVARLRGRGLRGIRKRSQVEILGMPLYDIAVGPHPERGEWRGHARGFIAIGDFASGVIALGGLCRGVVAFGGVAVGLISVGGLSLGLLLGVGGVALGGAAVGGFSAGGVAVGGFAVGRYACGGEAHGPAVVSARGRRDPEAVAFFERWGLGTACAMR
jgi:hypothetical protein